MFQKLLQQLPINYFPFFAMRLYPVGMLFKGQQVSQLMQQSDQERKRIQAAIYTDAVIAMMGPVTVIAKNAFPVLGNC